VRRREWSDEANHTAKNRGDGIVKILSTGILDTANALTGSAYVMQIAVETLKAGIKKPCTRAKHGAPNTPAPTPTPIPPTPPTPDPPEYCELEQPPCTCQKFGEIPFDSWFVTPQGNIFWKWQKALETGMGLFQFEFRDGTYNNGTGRFDDPDNEWYFNAESVDVACFAGKLRGRMPGTWTREYGNHPPENDVVIFG
jgi:hypothetical protein